MDIFQKKKDNTDEDWIENIEKGNKQAFENLFFEYFYDLTAYAIQITESPPRAKDIVQEVFYRLWKRRERWNIQTSVKAYLFRAVHNEALNQIDKKRHREDTREKFAMQTDDQHVANFERNETQCKLVEQIWAVVSELPDQRRAVFVLHRKHGLSYKEIAQVLDISRKTVENHMGLALDDIRERIDEEYLG